ncbi:MAG TPA: hypothetical protein VNZ53_32465 [Steroidobacteraceae bacterium]|jgi:hypothetical protein|nr:hypothetical protein [Steroidobacteraceae bacterium]
MTLVLQNWSGSFSQVHPYAQAPVMPTLAVDNATPYSEETVLKILAARDGKNASAPADKDKFLDWLNE